MAGRRWCGGDAGYQGGGKREAESAEALGEKVKASVRAKSLPPTAIGGGASLPEGEGSVRLREKPAPLQNGVRYRGLMKNRQRLALLFGLGNLLTAEGQLRG